MRDDEFIRMQLKSTIVRSNKARGRRAVRTGLAALSAVAPAIAARIGERLLLTPPRSGAPPGEAAYLRSAQPGTLRVASGLIRTWSWGRGPAVVLVHGWGGRGTDLGGFVMPLLARGLSVLTFDAPGHGASDGRLSSVPAFVPAIAAVDRALGPVRGLIAHSIGAVAAAGAMGDGLDVEAAVFVAPPADLGEDSVRIATDLGLSRRARDLMQQRVERRVGISWSALDVVRLAPALDTPLLVIHDREDAETPWQSGARIAQAWPGAALKTTQGLGHRRILRDPSVVEEIVTFITSRIAGAAGPGGPASGAILTADGKRGREDVRAALVGR